MIYATLVNFSGSISLGVLLLGVLASGLAIWRTQSISALRQAADDLRNDRDDWKARYQTQVDENTDLRKRMANLTASCQALELQVVRLEERSDTSSLAKEAVVAAFRDEMRTAVARLEELDTQKLSLLNKQSDQIQTLISRDPSLRTRAADKP
jgi:predicted nuclease with TOPRIM domain